MIPARAHFCWIGPSLPWAYVFAVLSAARQSELDEVVLHHTDALEDSPARRALEREPGVRLARIDPYAWMEQAGAGIAAGSELAAIYRRVENPVARSNMLRAAVLCLEGGIYLDLDTITVRSLRPLLEAHQFLGYERIVWPHFVKRSRSPRLWAKSLMLDGMRDLSRRLPQGYRVFEKVERLYYRGINGAILGAEPGGALLSAYLRAMTEVPRERQLLKHALGTHLLQQQVERYRGADLVIHEPAAFYPLAPEISEHWFRVQQGARLEHVILPETRIVHWYASVRTKPLLPRISPAYVAEHEGRQLYSALVSRYVGALVEEP